MPPLPHSPSRQAHSSEAIQVEMREGIPARLIWRGRPFRVTGVEATWCADGKWWLDAQRQGYHRRYYRLSLLSPNRTEFCVEIYQLRSTWAMSRVLD